MRILVLPIAVSLFVACSVADLPTGTNEPEIVPTEPTCGGAPSKLSADAIGKLATCECKAGGSARCVPTSLLPGELASKLDTCTAGACVPDTLLAKGDQPLPACKASGGKDGRCLSLCVPMVAQYASMLTRGEGDVCPTDERCVPCDSPLDGTKTGVCEIGRTPGASCGGAPPDGGAPTVPAPGAGAAPSEPATRGGANDCCRIEGQLRGKCVHRGSAPRDLAGRLEPRECSASDLCAPAESLEGAPPTTCAGGNGVCVSRCVQLSLSEQLTFDLGGCRADQRCVPCVTDLLTRTPTGAPGCPR